MTFNSQPYFWISEKLTPSKSMIHGHGLHAKADIERNELLVAAGGKVMTFDLYQNFKDETSLSFIPIPNSQLVLVATAAEALNASGLNHSCHPNLSYTYGFWKSNRQILAGEEVTIDYSEIGYNEDVLIRKCLCGVKNCRTVVKGRL